VLNVPGDEYAQCDDIVSFEAKHKTSFVHNRDGNEQSKHHCQHEHIEHVVCASEEVGFGFVADDSALAVVLHVDEDGHRQDVLQGQYRRVFEMLVVEYAKHDDEH
jgi:hypothetical protein